MFAEFCKIGSRDGFPKFVARLSPCPARIEFRVCLPLCDRLALPLVRLEDTIRWFPLELVLGGIFDLTSYKLVRVILARFVQISKYSFLFKTQNPRRGLQFEMLAA